MKVLALDFGEKRIGVAQGDSSVKIAFPLEVLSLSASYTSEKIFERIIAFLLAQKTQKILVGHPGSFFSEPSEQAQKCQAFADELEDALVKNGIDIPVEFIDEVFSSRSAERKLRDTGVNTRQQRGQKDAIAAANFLQTYFDLLGDS